MRLDKYLSNATDLSRNEVKRLIRGGEVSVNDMPATNAAQKVTGSEEICVSGSPIGAPGYRYFMLNKPAGVVSATKDRDHPTAIELIYEHRHDNLQIAGRLDIDTTGLLLITDDGQWNHRITSPRSACQKTYRVALEQPLDESLVKKFSAGIWLKGEKRRCLPADLVIADEHTALLTISEGKYHQVKRMFATVDNHVTALHRERIGDIVLDPDLPPGEYRPLTQAEIESIG
jgi:16S rRNA pseudouridine516 synthase